MHDELRDLALRGEYRYFALMERAAGAFPHVTTWGMVPDFRKVGLPLLDNPSHIAPLIVGETKRCKRISDALLERHGVYLQPINYPTVPKGTERLRITPTPFTPSITSTLLSPG